MTTTFSAKGDIQRIKNIERISPSYRWSETRDEVTYYPSIFWRIPVEDPFDGPKKDFLRELLLTPQADSGESRLQDIQYEARLFLEGLYPFRQEFFEDEYVLPFKGGRLRVAFKVTYKKYIFLTIELNPR